MPLLRYSTSCLKLVSKPVFIFAWWYSPIQYTKNVARQEWKASLSLLLICLVLYTKEAWRYMYPKAGQEAHKPILLTWVKNLKGVFLFVSRIPPKLLLYLTLNILCGLTLSPEISDSKTHFLTVMVTEKVGKPWTELGVVLFNYFTLF